MIRAMVVGLLAALAGCTEVRDRVLPVSIPLALRGGLLYVHGSVVADPEVACDEGRPPAERAPALLDVGTPLSAFRAEVNQPPLRLPSSHVFLAGDHGGQPGPTRVLLCQASLVRIGLAQELFQVRWDASALPVSLVVGSDLLRRFSLLFSFAAEPDDPMCQRPPCLRLGRGDLSNSCQIAHRGDAVFPFQLGGGDLLVEVGDNVLSLPPGRITLPACLEPWPDPLAGRRPVPCIDCERLRRRREEIASDPRGDVCRRAQLEDLERLLCSPSPPRRCPEPDHRLPAPAAAPPGCPEPKALEDVLVEEGLHDRRYQPGGVSVRLLLSTALPGLVLSQSAFARLRGQSEAEALLTTPAVALQMPGHPPELAHRVTLGRAGGTALALVSRERHLSPCEELARSRRQRFGLPRLASEGCLQGCMQAACLVNLGRDPAQQPRRCGFGGVSPELACDDLRAPVASVIEIDGPLSEVLVVADSARLLQAVNADLRSSSAQVDGVIGVALLERLELEIDYPAQRIAAHCRCGSTGCRAYRRFTYLAADECAPRDLLCLPEEPDHSPGALVIKACREPR
ncbi:MAG: hypothetical protein RMK29_03750 [Myxococcales bacterium]|nr:hypothetical protein [Myxococcota bacterium]MDW8280801.1 hypothetical protein [Myxococcales bacterium]